MNTHCTLKSVLIATAFLLTMPGNADDGTDSDKKARACQENLAKIDGSKEQFALEFKLPVGGAVTWQNLLDPEGKGKVGEGYLRRKTICPSGGTYSINPIGKDPTCSIGTPPGSETRTSETLKADTSQTTSAERHVLL